MSHSNLKTISAILKITTLSDFQLPPEVFFLHLIFKSHKRSKVKTCQKGKTLKKNKIKINVL